MAALWNLQRKTRNAGWVDVAWTVGIGILGLVLAMTQSGWGPRRMLVGALIGAWSLRLSLHLFHRVANEAEDGRYSNLRASLGQNADRWFFWFFQAQAILVIALAAPVGFIANITEPAWRIWDGAAVLLFAIALIGEAIADRQLRAFRGNAMNRGKTCRSGLWRYSRHPNYFFEWIHWWAYPVMAFGVSGAGWLWLAPVVMGLLIRYVTGIPPTEAQSVRSRGQDYRDYQRTTNAFVPGPPRNV